MTSSEKAFSFPVRSFMDSSTQRPSELLRYAFDLLMYCDDLVTDDVQEVLELCGVVIGDGTLFVMGFAPYVALSPSTPLLEIIQDLTQAVEEKLSLQCIHTTVEYHGTVLAVCYFPHIDFTSAQATEAQQFLVSLGTQVRLQYETAHEHTLICAVSMPGSRIQTLSHLVQQVTNCIDFMRFMEKPGGPVLSYKESSLSTILSMRHDMHRMAQTYVAALSRMDLEALNQVMLEMVRQLTDSEVASIRHIHFALHLFFSYLLELLQEGNISGMDFIEEHNVLGDVLGCHTISEIKEHLCQFNEALFDTYTQHTMQRELVCLNQAKQYIFDHLSNETLSITEVAAAVGVPISSFSRNFKRFYQRSPSIYIRELRVARAKGLLRDGMPLEDVMRTCGFGSLNTFYRSVKQIEGVTPASYRKREG